MNLVILVRGLGIKLMSLLTPGQQSILLHDHIFILVSQASCHHQPTSNLKQGVRIIPFWTRKWQTWTRSGFLLIESIETPELDATIEKHDGVPSSVSLGFLCSISDISDTPKLQISIKFCKLWGQASALHLPVPVAGKMSTSKLIQ